MTSFSRIARPWVVPVVIVGVFLGGAAIVKLVPAGADTPNLPPLTPAELLAKVRTAQVGTLSGTVQLTSNLGLPSTSALSTTLGGNSSITLATLLSGTHSADLAMDGPDHIRVTTAKPLAETNWVRNGTDLWTYDSTTLRATHATVPASTPSMTAGVANTIPAIPPDQTPAQFAQELLDRVTPGTAVRVDTPSTVAGRPAYELVLSPQLAASTVREVVVSVDAASGLPLAVRLDSKSGSNPAFTFGFTSISFAKPAASTFVFTPPPGSTVVQAGSAPQLLDPALGRQRRFEPGRFAARGPKGQMVSPPAVAPPTTPREDPRPTTIGKDWSTVAVLSTASVRGLAVPLLNGAPTITVGSHHGRVVTSSLLTAIVLDDGRIAVGALTPDALAAAVAAG